MSIKVDFETLVEEAIRQGGLSSKKSFCTMTFCFVFPKRVS